MSNRKLRHGADEVGSSELLDEATLQEIVNATEMKQAAKSPDADTDECESDHRADNMANATTTEEKPRGGRARRSSELSEELLQDIVSARHNSCRGEKEVENTKPIRMSSSVREVFGSPWHSRQSALKRGKTAPGAFKVSKTCCPPIPASTHLSAKHGLEFETASSQALSAFLVTNEGDKAAPSTTAPSTTECTRCKGRPTRAGSSLSHASSSDDFQQDEEQLQMVLPTAAAVITQKQEYPPLQDKEQPQMILPTVAVIKPMVDVVVDDDDDDDDEKSQTSVTSFCSTNGWSSLRQMITGILPVGGSQKQQQQDHGEVLPTRTHHHDEDEEQPSTLPMGAEVKSSQEDGDSIEIGVTWRTLVGIGLLICIILIPVLLVLSWKDRY